jgi:uncharacterized protein (TIGR00725 family)
MERRKLFVGVIGGSRCSEEIAKIAFRVGEIIAEEGHYLLCGGLTGVMEHAARGAKSKGGVTIGILPGESKATANPYIEIPIATGVGYARNAIIILTADVLIAVDGEYGTLSEIAYALIYNKPVYGIKTWDIAGVKHLSSPEEVREVLLSLC